MPSSPRGDDTNDSAKIELASPRACWCLPAENLSSGHKSSRVGGACSSHLDRPARPEQVVLSAIRSHPLTAPYPIVATWQKDKVVLAGRVGTKQVHDTAVRLAIDTALSVP